jgi:glycerol-3-phosphate dehydrogenase
MKDTKQQAGEAADRARSKWAEMKADAGAKMGDVKAKIDKRNDQIDAKMAVQDAADSEAEAMDAIDYADWAVENARLQTLDAIDARAYAEERAKAAGLS